MPHKSRRQVRDEFAASGVSITDWARQRGYSTALALAIVNDDERQPRYKCLRGQAHNIAVELGLKQGHVFKGAAGEFRLARAV